MHVDVKRSLIEKYSEVFNPKFDDIAAANIESFFVKRKFFGSIPDKAAYRNIRSNTAFSLQTP